MRLTRTQWLGLGIVGVLVVFAAALAVTVSSGSGGDDVTGPGTSSVTGAIDGDLSDPDIAALPPEIVGDSEYSADDGLAILAEGSDGENAALRLSGGGQQIGIDLQILDRKIIQSSSLDVDVEEVGRSFQEIIRIAETAGGFVASSSFTNLEDGQIADLTIRVPSDGYQNVLAQIRGLGTVTTESADANDVTEEFTDLNARLTTLQATERRYLELLSRAETIEDILLVQDRLDFVRGQIEQVQGRINLLEHLTDLGTITIHLRPLDSAVAPPTTGGGGPDPIAAATAAWETSLDALAGIAAAALIVIVFSWWLVPPLAIVAIVARWWLVRRPRRAAETPAL